MNPTQILTLIDKIMGFAAKKAGPKAVDSLTGKDDPFDIDKKPPGPLAQAGRIKGLNGAEVLADQVSEQLQSLGFKVKNYSQIATDARKAVDSGKTLDEAIEEAFVKARDRSDIIHEDDKGHEKTKGDGPSKISPEIPGPNLKIDDRTKQQEKTNADGQDDFENTPEARKFMDDLMKPGQAVDEIMLKKPEDLTQGEFIELKKAVIDLPAGPEQERLDKMATDFLEKTYGTGPAKHDAAGRMLDAKPARTIPDKPKPVVTADGKPLKYDLRRIGRNILRDAKDDGLASAVKRLQGGINFLGDSAGKGAPIVPELKQDGVLGPKTRGGLRQAVVRLGTPRVEEGMALGRFNAFARDGQKDGFGRLSEVTERSFAPLFRNSARPPKKPAERIEALTLQETLNDLGGIQFDRDSFRPLTLDGDIGPETGRAFNQVAAAVGPHRLTERFGQFLGFL